tara:strand:- start:2243 stop:3262 length:1020 start_codon:yes stop_codon:yes gene_type:complete
MKKSVFISSTYEDLKDYRVKIWELLESYNVHVNGMEKFGARKESPLDTCLKEVARSDIYIGIIAQRFGSIEPKSGKSYTQLEYEKAAELDKEVLIYFLDEENSKVNLKYVDFDEKREKLVEFKKSLKEKHTIDTFHNPNDLDKKLTRLFDELLKKKEISTSKVEGAQSNEIISKFELFPEKYNYSEVLVSISLKGKAFPLSKSICKTFGLEFGNTIGINFNFIGANIEDGQIQLLVINEESSKFYFELNRNVNIEIVGQLIFSDKRPETTRAVFFDKSTREKRLNPDYDPTLPSFDLYSISDILSKNEKYFYETKLVKGDGIAVLKFIKLVDVITDQSN